MTLALTLEVTPTCVSLKLGAESQDTRPHHSLLLPEKAYRVPHNHQGSVVTLGQPCPMEPISALSSTEATDHRRSEHLKVVSLKAKLNLTTFTNVVNACNFN